MRYIYIIFILICLSNKAQTPLDDPHWEFVWGDEFNTNTIDETKWNVINWAHGNTSNEGKPNEVLQTLYLSSNVTQYGGSLILKMNGNNVYCPQNPSDLIIGAREKCHEGYYNVNSGWVESKEAYNTKYGYIEAKIRVPYGHSFFPGFWTFVGPGVSNNSNAAEIDIFEMLGGGRLTDFDSPDILTTNIWTEYPSIVDHLQEHKPTNFNYTQWNTYAVEWSPSKIVWYVNHSPIRVLKNHQIIDPVRVLFNFAVRPDLPPDYSTPFPSEMLVDYVKVYSLKKDCGSTLNACNYDFSNHDNKVKNTINIGNGTCSNSLSSGDNVILRASNGVEIKGSFEVPVNAELYIDANNCQ